MVPHPTLPEIFTLGECHTEVYPSDFGSADTTRSVVVLYHGSFDRLAQRDDGFDWEDELWETLTHELQHHLESLATESGLEDFDYAADEHFKHVEGEPFDPHYYRAGIPVAEGVWAIDQEHFYEIRYRADMKPADPIELHWHGRHYQLPRPADIGDVCFLWIAEGLDAGPADLTVVLARDPSLAETLKGLFQKWRPRVVDAEVVAHPTP